MSQDSIDKILAKRKSKWFTSKEIADIAELSLGAVCHNLKKMRKNSFILWKTSKKRESLYLYKYKQM